MLSELPWVTEAEMGCGASLEVSMRSATVHNKPDAYLGT